MSELKCQRELIEAAEAAGGFGVKLSNRFIVGVPDLLVKLPQFPTMIIECKETTWPKLEKTPLRIELTPLQRKFMMDFRAAGGQVGWVLFCQDAATRMAFASPDLSRRNVTQADMRRCGVIKGKATPWLIETLLQDILALPTRKWAG